ncbi:hypothetical protein ERJ75_000291500 [Trypanosoma vivax]|nr:hypothetical protein ERJ75_000291500 [Trypanosoma vivax]
MGTTFGLAASLFGACIAFFAGGAAATHGNGVAITSGKATKICKLAGALRVAAEKAREVKERALLFGSAFEGQDAGAALMALERVAAALDASGQEMVAGAGSGQRSTYPPNSRGQGAGGEGGTRAWVNKWLRARRAAAGQALNAAIAEERATAFARQISEFIQLFFKVTGSGGKGCIVATGTTANSGAIKGCEEKRSDALKAAKTLLENDLKTKQPSKALEGAIDGLDKAAAITEDNGQKSTNVCPLTTEGTGGGTDSILAAGTKATLGAFWTMTAHESPASNAETIAFSTEKGEATEKERTPADELAQVVTLTQGAERYEDTVKALCSEQQGNRHTLCTPTGGQAQLAAQLAKLKVELCTKATDEQAATPHMIDACGPRQKRGDGKEKDSAQQDATPTEPTEIKEHAQHTHTGKAGCAAGQGDECEEEKTPGNKKSSGTARTAHWSVVALLTAVRPPRA